MSDKNQQPALNSMTFPAWVKHAYGDRGGAQAAEFLGLPRSTVGAYRNLSRFPGATNQELIKNKSAGLVNVDLWRSDYLNKARGVA